MRSALREFEAFAATRIRLKGAQHDRVTGNFWPPCSRMIPPAALDPHLHTHCIVFNATFDLVENRWKALQNYELLRARKFAENVITMNSPANCGHSAIRFATRCGVIFKSKAFPKSFASGFPSGMPKLTRRWPICWPKTLNWPVPTSMICALDWPRSVGRGNKGISAAMNCEFMGCSVDPD